jgi:hypothetical protein
MKILQLSKNLFEISDAAIHGHNWKLMRKPGAGTYARIAGQRRGDRDEMVIIEEHTENRLRSLWDTMNNLQCAGASYMELVKKTKL